MAGNRADELEPACLCGSEEDRRLIARHGVRRDHVFGVVPAAEPPMLLSGCLYAVGHQCSNFNVMLCPAIVDQGQPNSLADRYLEQRRVEPPLPALDDTQRNVQDVGPMAVLVAVVESCFVMGDITSASVNFRFLPNIPSASSRLFSSRQFQDIGRHVRNM